MFIIEIRFPRPPATAMKSQGCAGRWGASWRRQLAAPPGRSCGACSIAPSPPPPPRARCGRCATRSKGSEGGEVGG
eukprot:5412296-Pyramimonas_sp.AAC.1